MRLKSYGSQTMIGLALKLGGIAMPEFLQEYSAHVEGTNGTVYVVRSYAEERADGTWKGWLEFHPTSGSEPVLRTGQETSQPSRVTVEYWASGLEPIYFEGALARAT